jgi:rare lipoprotein A
MLLAGSGAIWGCAAVSPGLPTATGPGEANGPPFPRPIGGRPEVGLASWYGAFHQGLLTASGETFDMDRLTAAHRTLPLGTRLRVTNLENGHVVRVRVNDRGPYVPGRIVDLSRKAARALDMVDRGVALVRLEVDGA